MAKTVSKIGMNRYGMYDQLCDDLSLKFGGNDIPAGTLAEWAVNTPIILDGRKFTFNKHEYLVGPYNDSHPDQTEIKAAQLGLTTEAMLRAMYGARYVGYRGILYLFPSRTDVTEFSKGRVDPLVQENPDTLGKWIRDTDSANVKKVWNCHVYLRGMRSRVALKSVPIDFIIFDEMDEAAPNSVDMAMERMSHSEFKHVLKLSNPTLPDYGIDKAFQETDQRFWHIKCGSCGEWTNLDETFPECLLEVGDRVIRACKKCKGELNPSIGEWVAKHPGVIERRGYHYSQLFSHYVEPASILHQFRTTSNLKDFYNLKLGRAYADAQDRLSVEEVLALCENRTNQSDDPGPCSMGVDQGKTLHVVIGKRSWDKVSPIVHIGEYDAWEKLDSLMKRFNVGRCVVDAMPETRNARAFAERHRGKVFLCYYSDSHKGNYRYNEADMTVLVNRTESLDASHTEISYARITLPHRSGTLETFANHCHNIAKTLEEDEETGSKRYVYVKLASGPDHYRHSLNYQVISSSYGSNSLFAHSDFRMED